MVQLVYLFLLFLSGGIFCGSTFLLCILLVHDVVVKKAVLGLASLIIISGSWLLAVFVWYSLN
jgi:hypothetical protein